MRAIITSMLAVIALYGCAATGKDHTIRDWSVIDTGPVPVLSDIQPAIEESIRSQMDNPGATSFSGWTRPFRDLRNWSAEAPIEGLWSLCVDVSSEDASGAVLGPKTYRVLVRDGQVVDIRDPGPFGSHQTRQLGSWRRHLCESGGSLGHSPPLVK